MFVWVVGWCPLPYWFRPSAYDHQLQDIDSKVFQLPYAAPNSQKIVNSKNIVLLRIYIYNELPVLSHTKMPKRKESVQYTSICSWSVYWNILIWYLHFKLRLWRKSFVCRRFWLLLIFNVLPRLSAESLIIILFCRNSLQLGLHRWSQKG